VREERGEEEERQRAEKRLHVENQIHTWLIHCHTPGKGAET
jgi:hypothetical protein